MGVKPAHGHSRDTSAKLSSFHSQPLMHPLPLYDMPMQIPVIASTIVLSLVLLVACSSLAELFSHARADIHIHALAYLHTTADSNAVAAPNTRTGSQQRHPPRPAHPYPRPPRHPFIPETKAYPSQPQSKPCRA